MIVVHSKLLLQIQNKNDSLVWQTNTTNTKRQSFMFSNYNKNNCLIWQAITTYTNIIVLYGKQLLHIQNDGDIW